MGSKTGSIWKLLITATAQSRGDIEELIDDVLVAVNGTLLTLNGGESLTSMVGTLVVAIIVFTHTQNNRPSGFGSGIEDRHSDNGVGHTNVRRLYGEGLLSASGYEVREFHSGRGLGVELNAIGDESVSGGCIDIELPREEVGEGCALLLLLTEHIGVEVFDDGTGEGFGVESGTESNAAPEDIGVGFVLISGLIETNAREDVALSNVFPCIRAQLLTIFIIFTIFVIFHESVPHNFIYFRIRQPQTAQKRALAPKSITCSISKPTPP